MLSLSLPSGSSLQGPLELAAKFFLWPRSMFSAMQAWKPSAVCSTAQHRPAPSQVNCCEHHWLLDIQMASVQDHCANSESSCSKTLLCSFSQWQLIIPEYHMASWHKCYPVSSMLSDSATKSHMEPSRAKMLSTLEFLQDSLNFFQENNSSGA